MSHKKTSNPIFRALVLEKTNGFCAYCGTYLTKEIYHIDHVIPKRRYSGTYRQLVERGIYPKYEIGSDHIDNLMPCCQSCNSCKRDSSLEEFRDRLYDRITRLNRHSSEYIIAKRFGLIEETDTPIVFYFEALDNYNKTNG